MSEAPGGQLPGQQQLLLLRQQQEQQQQQAVQQQEEHEEEHGEQEEELPAARRVLVDQRHKWRRIADWVSRDSVAATAATGAAPSGAAVGREPSPTGVELSTRQGPVDGGAVSAPSRAAETSAGPREAGSVPHRHQQGPTVEQQVSALQLQLATVQAHAEQRIAAAEAGAKAKEEATRRLLETAKQVKGDTLCGAAPSVLLAFMASVLKGAHIDASSSVLYVCTLLAAGVLP